MELFVSNTAFNMSILRANNEAPDTGAEGNILKEYCFIVNESEGWRQAELLQNGAGCLVLTKEYTINDLCSNLAEPGVNSGLVFAPLLSKDDNEKIKNTCAELSLKVCDSWKITYKKDYLREADNAEHFIKAVIEYATGRKAPAVSLQLATNEKGRTLQTIGNAIEILENDEALKGKIKYNTLTDSPWICCEGVAVPWEQAGTYREWNDLDTTQLYHYMEKYDLLKENKIEAGLKIVARNNTFNPIKDMLDGIKWDGVERVKDLLPDYLGADRTEYTAEIMRLVMLGAINRALNPGCKFDYVMILTGPQGNGKTTFCQRLAINDSFFTNSIVGDLTNKDTWGRLRGAWVVELGELLAVKRSREVEAVKSFITTTVDRYREAYGKAEKEHPRTCIFIGTTNADSFLTDQTGNRRFLPIETGKHKATKSLFDTEARADFLQAWAEVYEVYKKNNYSLIVPESITDELERKRAEHEEQNPALEAIADYLEYRSVTCARELFFKALGNDEEHPEKFTTGEARKINDILSKLPGWEKNPKKQRFKNHPVGYIWNRARAVADNVADFEPAPDFADLKKLSNL